MSRATRQAISLCTCSVACLKAIKEQKLIGSPDLKKELDKAIETGVNACATYPADPTATMKTLDKDSIWIIKKMTTWNKLINENHRGWDLSILLYTAHQSISDVLGLIRDPKKIKILEPILAPIEKILDFINERDTNFAKCRYADDTLKTLYKILGFVP